MTNLFEKINITHIIFLQYDKKRGASFRLSFYCIFVFLIAPPLTLIIGVFGKLSNKQGEKSKRFSLLKK
jgi:hypothetical protein